MVFNSHNLFLLMFAFIHVPSRFPLREDLIVPRSREVRRSQGGHLGRTYRGRLGAKVWPGSHRHMAWNSGLRYGDGRVGSVGVVEGLGMWSHIGLWCCLMKVIELIWVDSLIVEWWWFQYVSVWSHCLILFVSFKLFLDDYIWQRPSQKKHMSHVWIMNIRIGKRMVQGRKWNSCISCSHQVWFIPRKCGSQSQPLTLLSPLMASGTQTVGTSIETAIVIHVCLTSRSSWKTLEKVYYKVGTQILKKG